jgi:hypothetical protein
MSSRPGVCQKLKKANSFIFFLKKRKKKKPCKSAASQLLELLGALNSRCRLVRFGICTGLLNRPQRTRPRFMSVGVFGCRTFLSLDLLVVLQTGSVGRKNAIFVSLLHGWRDARASSRTKRRRARRWTALFDVSKREGCWLSPRILRSKNVRGRRQKTSSANANIQVLSFAKGKVASTRNYCKVFMITIFF